MEQGLASDVDPGRALRQAREGATEGFATLYRTHQPALLRYLRVLVGQDAEDVASETWLQATRDLSRFHGAATELRAWLFTIGRHRALDHLRASRRRPVDAWEPDLIPQPRAQDDPQTRSAEALSVESLATRQALALISELPRDQAEAVLLRVVAGFDAPTAAKILGKRTGAVRMAASRGLANLAARVQDGSPDRGVTLPDPAALNSSR